MLNFNIVDELLNIDSNKSLNNLIYIDTDSLFLQLPLNIEENKILATECIDTLQDDINNNYINKFLNLHNIKIREKEESPLLSVNFKNEYLIKIMILYSKKKYISVIIKYDKNGEIFYDIDLKGVEGKKATNKFVKIIVDDLLEYIKKIKSDEKIYDRYDLLYKILKIYITNIYKYNTNNIYDVLEYFSLPVNVNKNLKELKNVAGFYKGTIIFDVITKENYWNGRTGKGKWLCVKLKDESKIPEIISEFSKYDTIKQNKSIEEIIKDITIPDEYLQKESEVINDIFKYFELNDNYYIELLLKKIKLMYKPFDEDFCETLLKKQKKHLPNNYMIFGEKNIYIYEK